MGNHVRNRMSVGRSGTESLQNQHIKRTLQDFGLGCFLSHVKSIVARFSRETTGAG